MITDLFLALQSAPPASGVIVRLIEPPDTRIRDIVVGAVGLSGALAIAGVVIGLLLGGVMFWMRSGREDDSIDLGL